MRERYQEASTHSVKRVRLAICFVALGAWGAVPAHADSYLDQLNAELERVEKIDSSTTSAAKEERVRAGEGFSDGLSMEDFAQEMRTRHPGGNVLYIRLTRMEKVRVYEEYYLKGENYQIVVDVMAKWLAAR